MGTDGPYPSLVKKCSWTNSWLNPIASASRISQRLSSHNSRHGRRVGFLKSRVKLTSIDLSPIRHRRGALSSRRRYCFSGPEGSASVTGQRIPEINEDTYSPLNLSTDQSSAPA